MTSIPPAEITINESLLRQLLREQFPQFSHLEVEFLNRGWDNENYRLGNDYLIRVPRRKVGAELLLNEINWLPRLEGELALPIPAPIGVGQPGRHYPWHWLILPWFSGEMAGLQPLPGSEAFRLVDFLHTLHRCNPENAPHNPYRAIPLAGKAQDLIPRMEKVKGQTALLTPTVEAMWQEAIREPYCAEARLIHGDLHPRNIIVHEGRLAAVIDWGDITAGDPASDLSSLWMLFDDHRAVEEAFRQYGASQSLIRKSVGWAIFYGVLFVEVGLATRSDYYSMGKFILENLERR